MQHVFHHIAAENLFHSLIFFGGERRCQPFFRAGDGLFLYGDVQKGDDEGKDDKQGADDEGDGGKEQGACHKEIDKQPRRHQRDEQGGCKDAQPLQSAAHDHLAVAVAVLFCQRRLLRRDRRGRHARLFDGKGAQIHRPFHQAVMVSEKQSAQDAALFYFYVGHSVLVQQFARKLFARKAHGVLYAVAAPVPHGDDDLRDQRRDDGDPQQDADEDIGNFQPVDTGSQKIEIHKLPLHNHEYRCGGDGRQEEQSSQPRKEGIQLAPSPCGIVRKVAGVFGQRPPRQLGDGGNVALPRFVQIVRKAELQGRRFVFLTVGEAVKAVRKFCVARGKEPHNAQYPEREGIQPPAGPGKFVPSYEAQGHGLALPFVRFYVFSPSFPADGQPLSVAKDLYVRAVDQVNFHAAPPAAV